MSNPLLSPLLTSIEANETVALLTVVQATGLYQPSLGQRMLLWLDKPAFGTLNLGEMEAPVLTEARQAMLAHQPELLNYSQPEGDLAIFVEVQRRRPTLIIVGAGHVALPMAQLGKLIDFDVVVLDDRPQYANRHRFPMADHVLAQPFRETLRHWSMDSDTYIILVTRGHSHDVEALLEVLDSPARYIGMIGSKRRIKGVFDLLVTKQGIDPTKFDKVYAPIGLDIGAETPAEIAIAITAEIINLYRGGRSTPLSEALRADWRLPLHPGRI